MKRFLNLLLTLIVVGGIYPFQRAQAQGITIALLNGDGNPITSTIDGNQIALKIDLPQPVSADSDVAFIINGVENPVAACTTKAGKDSCQTESFSSLGWFWNADGSQAPQREVNARVNGQQAEGSLTVTVNPRPVVMAHGYNSNFHAWDNYLGEQGYLAAIGLHGYAVGDGQAPGVLNTGSLSNPTARTNTIAQNADVLGQYIDGVQSATGAEKVDLVVHSMGGMISRYYLDRVMKDVNVAQLIILGTPMAGSNCSTLPASLGIMMPASLEIEPSYMVGVFNQQIFRRRGVPFYAIAGTKLTKVIESPCTSVPSDVAVSEESAKAIPMPVQLIDLLHIELNTSSEVFSEFVKPHLQTPPGKFEILPDPPPGSSAPATQQFTKTYVGHITPGEPKEVTINIDANVAVANFALYDTTRSLDVSVVGASGNEIQLDATKNGLIRVDDPSTLIYLGYGFVEPKPGKWVVTLHPTASTPQQGADFAINALFTGGATLSSKLDVTTPKIGQPISFNASLVDATNPSLLDSAQILLRYPDGSSETLPMQVSGNSASLVLKPKSAGIHGAEVSVTSHTQDGFIIDRAAFLTFEVQPAESVVTTNRIVALVGLLVFSLIIAGVSRSRRRHRR